MSNGGKKGRTLTAAIQAAFSSVERARHSFLTEGFVHSAVLPLRVKKLSAMVREDASWNQRMVVGWGVTLIEVGEAEQRPGEQNVLSL